MLLIRRAAGVPRPGYWSPPTGWVEAGETTAQAAERETREELGVDLRAQREVWQCLSDDRSVLIDWWLVTGRSGVLQPAPDEVAEYRFVTCEDYFRLAPTFVQHHPFFRDILPDLLSAQR